MCEREREGGENECMNIYTVCKIRLRGGREERIVVQFKKKQEGWLSARSNSARSYLFLQDKLKTKKETTMARILKFK